MSNADDIVTKSAFASIAGVSCGRVSQWIAAGQITGAALVGKGHRARIKVVVALEQLKRNLDPSQHLANGRAQLGTGSGDIVDDIKAARLHQLVLINARLEAEAAVRAGSYVKVADVQQEIGRNNLRWLSVFEAALIDFATSTIAEKPTTTRDALQLLRTRWRKIREREAKVRGAEAATLPVLDEV